jgi:hypothetical protein
MRDRPSMHAWNCRSCCLDRTISHTLCTTLATTTPPLSHGIMQVMVISLSTFYRTLLSLLGTSLVAAACAFRAHRLVHRYYPCYKEHCKITSASLPSTFSFSVFPNFHVTDNLPVYMHTFFHPWPILCSYLPKYLCMHTPHMESTCMLACISWRINIWMQLNLASKKYILCSNTDRASRYICVRDMSIYSRVRTFYHCKRWKGKKIKTKEPTLLLNDHLWLDPFCCCDQHCNADAS